MSRRDERSTLVLLCSDPEAAAGFEGTTRVFSTDDVRKYGAIRIDGDDAGFWWVSTVKAEGRTPGVASFFASDVRFVVADGVKTLVAEHPDRAKASALALASFPAATTLWIVQHGDVWTSTAIGSADE